MGAATLSAAFEESCRAHASVLALVTPGESITYAELFERAERFAAALAGSGVRPGDRVAVWLPNGVDWLVAHWGTALAGCVVVPIGTRNRGPEVRHVLTQCEASALVMIDRFMKSDYLGMLAAATAGGISSLSNVVVRRTSAEGLPARAVDWTSFVDEGRARAALERARSVDPTDTHAIQYTSGTTGYPKGAMLSHEGLLRVARSHAASWKLEPGEAIFIPNPFSHIMGVVMAVLMPVVAGATLVTTAAFQPGETLSLVSGHRCVAMAGTPSHYLALANFPELDRYDLSSLRFGMCGGAALTPEVIARIVDKLRLGALMNGLGMTEASGSVTRTSPEAPIQTVATTIGHPMPWLEVRVVDPATRADAKAGDAGELVIRGPGVMKGYFRAPRATAEALSPDGWLSTGDLVRARDDGAFEFVGRIKEMFTVGGFNVYPAEVERALSEHPAIAESCVVGVPDDRLDEVPFAFVVLRPKAIASEDEIIAFLRERIANYKVPRYVATLSEMPVLGSGKVDRLALRERALGQCAAMASAAAPAK